MEKDFRLIVKNLPSNIVESKVRELFEEHVDIKKVELKEKKNFNDEISKFCFIEITATDKKLNTCFNKLKGKTVDGSEITVELAKESFIDRLKKERAEQEKPKKEFARDEQNDDEYSANHSFPNSQNKSIHKKFSDSDLTTDLCFSKEKKRKKFEEEGHNDSLNNKKFKEENFKEFNNFDGTVKKNLDEKKETKLPKNVKASNEKPVNDKKHTKYGSSSNEPEKRLMIAKQKRHVYKIQKQTIQNALKSVDGSRPNKKIVFDENLEPINNNSKTNTVASFTEKSNHERKNLFETDDEDEQDYHLNVDELEAKADLKNKLSKFKINTTDKRFTLNERFVDEDDNVKKNETSEESSIINEKKWQLNILEEVLGKSIKTTTTNDNEYEKKKYGMIRYDPSNKNHQKYEVTAEKNKDSESKKKKKKSCVTEVKVKPAAPVSAEVFYEVSDTLIENLKTDPNEKFSLFKNLGRETSSYDGTENRNEERPRTPENFQFKSSGKNPFKYDSTDEEDVDKIESKELETTIHQKDQKFFTDIDENDSIILEVKRYFENIPVCDRETFKYQRRELKEIIRSKNRRYLRKTAPTNRKKVWKVNKKSK